jgi:hypothetical protein
MMETLRLTAILYEKSRTTGQVIAATPVSVLLQVSLVSTTVNGQNALDVQELLT